MLFNHNELQQQRLLFWGGEELFNLLALEQDNYKNTNAA
jgi:hypothetical protein